jgi:hypothetical protein
MGRFLSRVCAVGLIGLMGLIGRPRKWRLRETATPRRGPTDDIMCCVIDKYVSWSKDTRAVCPYSVCGCFLLRERRCVRGWAIGFIGLIGVWRNVDGVVL